MSAFERAMESVDGRRSYPADQQGYRRPLSAGLHNQTHDGAGGGRCRALRIFRYSALALSRSETTSSIAGRNMDTAMSICSAASWFRATSSFTKLPAGSASIASRRPRTALGLGAQTGIELPGEKAGIVPGRAWKLARYGVPWQQGETLNTGIGQGYLNVTPLQLCTLAARIASGNAVSPRLTRVVGSQTLAAPGSCLAWFLRQRARHRSRWHERRYQSRRRHRLSLAHCRSLGCEMAGKTGTAQVRVITREEHHAGVKKESVAALEAARSCPVYRLRTGAQPRYACATSSNTGHCPIIRKCRWRGTFCVYAQQRNPLNLPTAYPLKAATYAPVEHKA